MGKKKNKKARVEDGGAAGGAAVGGGGGGGGGEREIALPDGDMATVVPQLAVSPADGTLVVAFGPDIRVFSAT